jgi:hypothetical protein
MRIASVFVFLLFGTVHLPIAWAVENRAQKLSPSVDLGTEYSRYRDESRSIAVRIADLKARRLVFEGVLGYLRGDERLQLEEREAVQRENVCRENIFEIISKKYGKPRYEIAATFARMAENASKP